MIEDVELTRQILELYADEESWPSSIGEAELRSAFPNESHARLVAHVVWATDSGMFKGTAYETVSTMQGTYYIICSPDGLSKLGSDYVTYARSGLWDKAKNMIQEKAVPLTTQSLVKLLPKLAEDLI